MPVHELAPRLYQLRTEIDRYGAFTPYPRREFLNMPPQLLYAKAFECFANINHLLEDGHELQGEPGHALTRRMFEIAGVVASLPDNVARPDVLHMAGDPNARTCFQSELYFVRSFRQVSARRKPGTDHVPAAILFDETGPFAYQKASGRHTAFAWRDSWMGTQAGRRFIPAGYLFELRYGNLPSKGERRWYPDDPRLSMVGRPNNAGLVRYTPQEPEDVILGRLSTQYVTRLARLFLHGVAADELLGEYEIDLRGFRMDASMLTNRAVAQKAASFLAKGWAAELA